MDTEEHKVNHVFLLSVVSAMDQKLVELPRYVHHYRNAIWTAIEGDTTLLLQAVENVGKRIGKFRRQKTKSGPLSRWLMGMVKNYDRVYVTLTNWLERLNAYWGGHHGTANGSDNKSLTRFLVQPSEEQRSTRPKLSKRVRGGKVQEI